MTTTPPEGEPQTGAPGGEAGEPDAGSGTHAGEGASAASVVGGSASAYLVAAGILLSRVAGLFRQIIFARFFGTSASADAFSAATRMPNALQNLLGEGVLSASFIPVYSELLEQGREEEAGRVAGAIFAVLFALAGAIALLGIALAPVLVRIFTPGFDGLQYDLTVTLVRIIFPMTGILVLSAWSLGVLNSHRHFFLPYFAPVLWNGALIATMLFFGTRMAQPSLAIALGWGALVGGLLQFLVQLPRVLRLERSLRIRWDLKLQGVRTALRNAAPAIAGRGVVQVSSYVDLVLGSLLVTGAVATLSYAQMLYMLPISLFGMSVAAAELPELARQRTGRTEALRQRVNSGLARISFYVVPSIFGFLVLGDVIIAALFRRGDFGTADVRVVYFALAGYTVGLLASTGTRLFSSAFYGLHDTRTPAIVAGVRVVLSALLGVTLMVQFGSAEVGGRTFGPYGFGFLPELDADQPWGAAGLTLAAGIAAWVEWYLLRQSLRRRIGPVNPPGGPLLRMTTAAVVAAAAGRGIFVLLPELHRVLEAIIAAGTFGLVYFGVAAALGLSEASAAIGRVARLIRR